MKPLVGIYEKALPKTLDWRERFVAAVHGARCVFDRGGHRPEPIDAAAGQPPGAVQSASVAGRCARRRTATWGKR